MASVPPNSTLYVQNLNDKVKNAEIRRSLYAYFAAHGQILDIVTLKAPKLRGQAFIVFKDISSCTNALRQCQGFLFYNKPLKLAFAKTKSHATKDLEKWVSKNISSQPYLAPLLPEHQKLRKRPIPGAEENQEEKKVKVDVQEPQDAAPEEKEALSHVLFLENLPGEANETMLSLLFEQYPGFKEVRIVPGRAGIAFVEYETDSQAAMAKEVLNAFKLTPTHAMKISFRFENKELVENKQI